MAENKRQFERAYVPLKARFDRDGAPVECLTRDISLGGAFMITNAALPYGTRMVIEIDIPALDVPARVECTVRWSSADGMGVQFHVLRARETWAINQLTRG